MIKLHLAKLQLPPNTPYKTLPVFICNDSYHFTHLKIYKNGYVDCWELVTLDEFIQKVAEGWVTVELDETETKEIDIFGVGSVSSGFQYRAEKSNQDLILEVMDIIAELNDLPTSSVRCVQAWHAYQSDSSEKNRENLKEAYEAMPHHLRMYVLGDQDRKDRPIRQAIYEEKSSIFDPFFNLSAEDLPLNNLTEKTLNQLPTEHQFMEQLQANLQHARTIKQRYEQEIQQLIQQKLNEFHQEINLPMQYLELEIESEENEDGVYQTQLTDCKIHIALEL